jgi:hypothetical protein
MRKWPLAFLALILISCGDSQTTTNSDTHANSLDSTATNSGNKTLPVVDTDPIVLTMKIDGKEWKGGCPANFGLLYEQGVEMFNAKGPYLQIAFTSAVQPDNRQLTISIDQIAMKAGKVSTGNLAVLLSGAATGQSKDSQLQDNGPTNSHTDFTFEITAWEAPTNITGVSGIGKLSGKFSGKLRGTLGSPAVQITEGVFENLPITVYPDKY